MPNLLSLPRELRDDIYARVLNQPLRPRISRASRKPRKRLQRPRTAKVAAQNANSDTSAPADSIPDSVAIDDGTTSGEYLEGEGKVHYPTESPLPPTHSLFRASRQLRDELLDAVGRKKVHYRIRLDYRDDTDTIYPTWVSVPALWRRIDVLDVDIYIRAEGPSSICSMASDDGNEDAESGICEDPLRGCVAILQRFLDRGVDFLSKKKRRKVTVGLMVVRLMPEDLTSSGSQDEVDGWLRGESVGSEVHTWQNSVYRALSGKLDRVAFYSGQEQREWSIQDLIADRKRSGIWDKDDS